MNLPPNMSPNIHSNMPTTISNIPSNLPNVSSNIPTTIFNPVDINSFSIPATPPMMYPSGASSPMSMNSDMMMNYMNPGMTAGNLSPNFQNFQTQSFSSNNSSPIGPFGNTQNFNSLPLEIQQQSMNQQFAQVSIKNNEDAFKEAMGRVAEFNQAKAHFSEENDLVDEKASGDAKNKEEQESNGNSTPISDAQ